MADQNIKNDTEDVEMEYMVKFHCTELPLYVMCEGDEHYKARLRAAIERGRPITEEDLDRDFPCEDDNGDPILY